MAPFEREPMTSYSTLMVTFSLYASVSKLQPSEICLTSVGPHFDLFRSCEVQANGDSRPATHDFLFDINSNLGPICIRFRVTAPRIMLDFDWTSF